MTFVVVYVLPSHSRRHRGDDERRVRRGPGRRVDPRRTDRRDRAERRRPRRCPRQSDRRAWRLGASRLRADARAPLPDALSRLRRRSAADGLAADARVADGSGPYSGVAPRRRPARHHGTARLRHDHRADDGDGARYRCRVRSGGRKRHPGDDRQVHDGSRRWGPETVSRSDCRRRPGRRSTRAWRSASGGTAPAGTIARGVRAALRRVVHARAARGRREPLGCGPDARAHARVRIARRDRDRAAAVGRPERTSNISPASTWRRRACAPRTASGATIANRACSPTTASRSCTAPART